MFVSKLHAHYFGTGKAIFNTKWAIPRGNIDSINNKHYKNGQKLYHTLKNSSESLISHEATKGDWNKRQNVLRKIEIKTNWNCSTLNKVHLIAIYTTTKCLQRIEIPSALSLTVINHMKSISYFLTLSIKYNSVITGYNISHIFWKYFHKSDSLCKKSPGLHSLK